VKTSLILILCNNLPSTVYRQILPFHMDILTCTLTHIVHTLYSVHFDEELHLRVFCQRFAISYILILPGKSGVPTHYTVIVLSAY
jgi:hypothetical protein